jgi:hypothetical protein
MGCRTETLRDVTLQRAVEVVVMRRHAEIGEAMCSMCLALHHTVAILCDILVGGQGFLWQSGGL